MTLVEDKKLMDVLSNFRVKCKCGNTIVFVSNREKIICKRCSRYVYRNKKLEFKDKLERERRNGKRR